MKCNLRCVLAFGNEKVTAQTCDLEGVFRYIIHNKLVTQSIKMTLIFIILFNDDPPFY